MEDLSKEQEQEQQPFDQHKQGKRQGINLPTRAKQYSAITSASFKRSWPVWLVSLVMFLNGAWSIASILRNTCAPASGKIFYRSAGFIGPGL